MKEIIEDIIQQLEKAKQEIEICSRQLNSLSAAWTNTFGTNNAEEPAKEYIPLDLKEIFEIQKGVINEHIR